MKNLLLILLLANILYFLWGWFDSNESEPGVAIVDEADLGPTLLVAETEDAADSVGRDTEIPSTLAAVVGRSCVTIGPFREKDDADSAQSRYAGEGMRVSQRSGEGQFFMGHWVQIRNIPSRDESRRMLAVLKDGGLADAYPVETEDEGLKISLGLFGNLESAEKIELEAKSLGLDADVSARIAEGTMYYVDVALRPGKGAGDMIDLYGENLVALRAAATCPNRHE